MTCVVVHPKETELAPALTLSGASWLPVGLRGRLSRLPLLDQDSLAPSCFGWKYETPPAGRCRLGGSEGLTSWWEPSEPKLVSTTSDGREKVVCGRTTACVSLPDSLFLSWIEGEDLKCHGFVTVRLVADAEQCEHEPLTGRTNVQGSGMIGT